MDSDPLNLLHLKQLSKPISSDLHTNLLYLLGAMCVCVCVFACALCLFVCVCVHVRWVCGCVYVRTRADPIIRVFVPCVEYGFLCEYNVM